MVKKLEHLFDEFIYESRFGRKVRPDTIRGYSAAFELFLKLRREVTTKTLSRNVVIGFFKGLEERQRVVGKGLIKTGVKKSTIATYWKNLNVFFQWLKTHGYILDNPLAEMSCPTPSYEDKKFLKKEEVEKVLAAIHIHHHNDLFVLKRNLVLVHILLFCGLRREEILLLQIRDIDLERKVITIRAVTSKSKQSRQIPIHSATAMFIKDYLSARKHFATPFFLVSTKRDAQLTHHGLKHVVDTIKHHSGVSFHLHQLRHTFAVNFLKASNNIAKLKQLLGHKSIVVTMAYLRCLPVTEFRSDIESMAIDDFI
jgi:integrase/recombinase XerD